MHIHFSVHSTTSLLCLLVFGCLFVCQVHYRELAFSTVPFPAFFFYIRIYTILHKESMQFSVVCPLKQWVWSGGSHPFSSDSVPTAHLCCAVEPK